MLYVRIEADTKAFASGTQGYWKDKRFLKKRFFCIQFIIYCNSKCGFRGTLIPEEMLGNTLNSGESQ